MWSVVIHVLQCWNISFYLFCPISAMMFFFFFDLLHSQEQYNDSSPLFSSSAMISYNITTGDTLTKVFQRIPGGMRRIIYVTSYKTQYKNMQWRRFLNENIWTAHRTFKCLTEMWFVLCFSWSWSHTCWASLCHIALHCCVHAASLALSEHWATWEGKSTALSVI